MTSISRASSVLLLAALVALLVSGGAQAASTKGADTSDEKQQRKERIKRMYKLRFEDAPPASPATGSEEHRVPGVLPDTSPPAMRVAGRPNTTARPRAIAKGRASPRLGPSDDRSILGQEGRSIYFGQIYGKNAGGVVACNIDIATGTPNPTRGITYGLAVSCNNPGIRGAGIAHLGDYTPPTTIRGVQSGSFFNIQGDYNAPANYRSPAQYYQRESETQLENIYAYFDLTIDGVDGVDGWYTHPAAGGAVDDIQCTPPLQRKLTCQLITTPMPFLPTATACMSGDVCSQFGTISGIANALPGQVNGIVAAAQQEAFNSAVVAQATASVLAGADPESAIEAALNPYSSLTDPQTDAIRAAFYAAVGPGYGQIERSEDQIGGLSTGSAVDDALWDLYAQEDAAITAAEPRLRRGQPAALTLFRPVVRPDGSIEQHPYASRGSYDLDNLNAVERKYCSDLRHASECLRANSAKRYAEASGQAMYPGTFQAKDNKANAYLHCTWIGVLGFRLGQDSARQIGERHEQKARNPAVESQKLYRERKIMDLHNNNEGIYFSAGRRGLQVAVGSRLVSRDCRANARTAGSLWWLLPDRKGMFD